jgi:dCMP deaminase
MSTQSQKGWDEFFIRQAMLVAEKSKDPSTKVGCVIVGPDKEVRSLGFNGFPRGVREMALVDGLEEIELNVGGITTDGSIPQAKPIKIETVVESETEVDPERWSREGGVKYKWVEHAERNAVYNAARVGVSLKGCTAYLNWEPIPCADCTRAFIQAGIIEIVGPNIPFAGKGTGTHYHLDDCVTTMIDEARVTVRTVEWED